jgi:hypothetical protein
LLGKINEIRQEVYKIAHVTSKEAQRTLDGLKSRGFLWDQDGHLTEDARDETMYRVIERADINDRLWYVYRYSSVSTAVRYLRSRRYTRKSGEKCVISDGPDCDTVLIRRLQMDILTHVTMEDTEIYNKVSEICKYNIYEVNGLFGDYIQS